MANSPTVAEAATAARSSVSKLYVEYWPIARLKRYEQNREFPARLHEIAVG
jgi:hypothetical protein